MASDVEDRVRKLEEEIDQLEQQVHEKRAEISDLLQGKSDLEMTD